MKRVAKQSNTNKGKPGSVRIISGAWRGRRLPVPNVEGLRPSTDRTRETLFNWLIPYPNSTNCLDVYAGSGALGLEALSRGAQYCLFMEKDKHAAVGLQNNLKTLNTNKAKVIRGDSLSLIATLDGQFDLVFIDPPFHQGLIAPTIASLLTHNKLAAHALVYVEQENSPNQQMMPSEFNLLKSKSTSQMHYGLWQYSPSPVN
jgi:16S rRNA (guanine966-N2)-methyltransferase